MKKIILAAIILALVSALAVNARTNKKTRGKGTATTAAAPVRKARPEAVDLGLAVKWADRNLGAARPSDAGNYYAWGELKTKRKFDEANCSTWQRNFENYQVAGDTLYDVALKTLGEDWRMPSDSDFKALIDSCTWTWTKADGMTGYKVTGPSGKSIFLPAAGLKIGESVLYTGDTGYYWSDEPISTRLAGCLMMDKSSYSWFSFTRWTGLPVRAVKVGKDERLQEHRIDED